MRQEPDDDEPMDAVLLELQVQVGVGKAAGTPMLLGHDVAGLWRELAADLATPSPGFDGPARPGCFLDRCDVLPGLVVARAVPVVQGIHDPQPRPARRG